jgi:hypothetical protein
MPVRNVSDSFLTLNEWSFDEVFAYSPQGELVCEKVVFEQISFGITVRLLMIRIYEFHPSSDDL